MAVDLLVDIADIISEPVSGSVSIRPAGGATLYREDGQIIASVHATRDLGTGGGPTKVLFEGVPTSQDAALAEQSKGYALEVTAHLRRRDRRQGNVQPTTWKVVVLISGTGVVNVADLAPAEALPRGWITVEEILAASTLPLGGTPGQTIIRQPDGSAIWDDLEQNVTTNWTAQQQAQAQGFWMVVSEEPPTETTMYGVPVVWVPKVEELQAVPIVPREPAWQLSEGTFSVPSLVGVDYVYDGQVVTGTVTVPTTRPLDVTVTTVAHPGYYLTSPYQWTKNYPDPDAYTLQSSDDFTGLAAGDQFITAPSGAVTGWNYARTWDNALGGTTVTQWRYNSNVNSNLTLTKATGDGAIEYFGSSAWTAQRWVFDTPDLSQVVDIDVAALPTGATNSSWYIGLGGTIVGNNTINAVTIRVEFKAAKWNIVFSSPGLTDVSHLYPGTEAGLWRFEILGDVASVVTPSGQNHTYSVAGTTAIRGRVVDLNVTMSNLATPSHVWRINSIKAGSRVAQ